MLKRGAHKKQETLFSDVNTIQNLGEVLNRGLADNVLHKKRTSALLGSQAFADKGVTSMTAKLFRTALTGGAVGTSAVVLPCYDVPMGSVGLGNRKSGMRFVCVRQPVINARNVMALTTKHIKGLPSKVSQYRAQFRQNGVLKGFSKGIVCEVKSLEILHDDGTVELITEPTLIIGERDVSIGKVESTAYDVEWTTINRWKSTCAVHPDMVDAGCSLDFDGDLLQLYPFEDYLAVWDLIQLNWKHETVNHEKVAKVKIPWTEEWELNFLAHIGYACESGMGMGIYDLVIEALKMYEGKAADDVASTLWEGATKSDLKPVCEQGYQVCLDFRKRIGSNPDEVLDTACVISSNFYLINSGHLKKDPAKYAQGWFASVEPSAQSINKAYDGVRADYPPLCILKVAMARDRQGKLKNWIPLLGKEQQKKIKSQYTVLTDFLPEQNWEPDKEWKSRMFTLIQGITRQEQRVANTGVKFKENRSKEVVKYALDDFIETKRQHEIKLLIYDWAEALGQAEFTYLTEKKGQMREVTLDHQIHHPNWILQKVEGLRGAAQEAMLTAFFIDNWRRSPRDNRDFAIKYFKPEIVRYLHK
jgi:hypothetical protein